MIKNKNFGMLGGMLLIIFGVTALLLHMVGVHWYFLGWLEGGGRLLSFFIKILMVLSGAVLFFLSNVNWEREQEESQ